MEIGSVDVKVDALTGAIVTVDNEQDGAEGVGADEDTIEEGDQTTPATAPDVAG